jgi:3-oxoacyl-[acyl-carrier protein] reductase
MGASLILIARNETKLIETLAELPSPISGQVHHYLVADFSQPADLKKGIDTYIKKGNTIHILINNSGGPKGGPIKDTHVDEFITAFNQHLICNHILAQAVYPGMIAAGYGRIINVISTSVKQPLPNLGVSNTIRGAVASWSKTLANELGPFGITVNNVLPGATATGRLEQIMQNKAAKTGVSKDEVETEMKSEIPLGRLALPEEIAAGIHFLASPAASYINGINLPIDGGRTACL